MIAVRRKVVMVALLSAVLSGCIDDSDVQVIAHRGASFYAPEHTFAAYDLALRMKADWLEQDVQMTRDGHLVVLHDDSLDRTARGPREACTGLVRDRTLAELERCEVGSWFNAEYPERAEGRFVGARIPTLDAVLARYKDRARFYIETKGSEEASGIEEALLALLRQHRLIDPGAPRNRVIVQSFNSASLRKIHALDRSVPLVQLMNEPVTPDSLDGVLTRIAEYAKGIGPSRRIVSARMVQRAHELGLVVHPYTVNEPATMTFLLGLGVDGMFTDRPDLLRSLLSP
jgi:glycerophosphoryl diester phosphodiesterase